MPPALQFQSVSKAFSGQTVVDSVDLDVREGEFLTLLGASGCGKTTMLRMMAGFELATSGKIFIGDTDMTRTPPYRRNVGMVFQNLALFPHLSVKDNVAFGLKARDIGGVERNTRVDRVLETVGLGGYQERAVSQLSGGQMQRVALARSLVTGPKVLLLDEPLSALDLKLRRQMQGELKQIQRETGATFVFVTHDQEEAMSMSDRIAVIRDGRIVQLDTPDAIYYRPASDFVASTLGEANLFDSRATDRGHVVEQLGLSLSREASPPGADLCVLVRPENVAVAPAGQMDASVSATVLSSDFAGASISYQLELEDGQPVRARNTFAHNRFFRPGETVRIGINGADCVLVEKTNGSQSGS